MEEQYVNPPSVGKVAFKWGLITGLIMIVYSLVINMMGQFGNQALGAVSYVFIIFGIIMAHKEYKDSGDGYMSYGKGLGIGTLTTLIAAVLSAIFSYIYMTMIDPTVMDMIRDQQISDMEGRGMSDAQIEQAMSMTESFMSPGFISFIAVFIITLVGFILSLIITAFTKNSNPELEM
ncbi:DUF4199 domain-containing protein [Fulvivirga sedimenti]|uniref:DUF4199 domain-containing protein n=1 Tax=Fulvivirga sedimenti TaxID=2879465 RepID=A0A9X1HRZ7_9BACT|nr:DUF4199 domain-containing protein [Fulvivirga sedimenti]MCA6075314.1 DUF4199 domain-containing protein [Fulvivirga sedimenti]MCA6076491.1 DUF4199 domain-containing protein [Fulvivirga sedimenti]MCA6077619.1 DUF4199 domain-containing protein [Fulvivirga sedimenti]